MPNVTKIQTLGNSLKIIHDDNTFKIAHPTGNDLWIVTTANNGGGGDPEPLPDTYTVTSSTGEVHVLNSVQIAWAAFIINQGKLVAGVGYQGTIIAMMTAMVESTFLMYANSGIPESLTYPHDAVGSDNDSLGLFQQRPSIPWGTVAELMDGAYNCRAFFGGPTGPNAGSVPGLLDISGWESMSYGEAAQRVQGSAFPDRYETWKAAMIEFYEFLTDTSTPNPPGEGTFVFPFNPTPSNDGGDMVPTTASAQLIQAAEYGFRSWSNTFHEGMDFGYGAATAGAEIKAAGDGVVHEAFYHNGWGNHVKLKHNVNGTEKLTLYAHMNALPLVSAGDTVTQGQVIGYVGNTGNSFGAHLHFETWNTLLYGSHMNPRQFMELYGA